MPTSETATSTPIVPTTMRWIHCLAASAEWDSTAVIFQMNACTAKLRQMAVAQLVHVAAPAAVAIYARISDDRQDGAGVERQLQDCRTLVKRRGWGSALEFVDNSKSAYSGKIRPRYTELLAAVR